MAENFSGKHDSAISNFKKASEVIETRIGKLNMCIKQMIQVSQVNCRDIKNKKNKSYAGLYSSSDIIFPASLTKIIEESEKSGKGKGNIILQLFMMKQ